uniref:Uncharacterized protein n=1 Tax=Paramoeba aestuarina TaxID=180227 RepID=A0A7S4KHF5_9EUKA
MSSRVGGSSSGGPFSLTKFGKFARYTATPSEKEYMRMSNQKYIIEDTKRQKMYTLCRKCGNIRMTVNLDKVPSARIGLWGTCVNGLDYRHHSWVQIRSHEYQELKNLELRERLNHFIFDLQE